ncbi:MAG: hypothetical protein Q4D98_13020 [Planctomycetia bacterium]|nr:hypothetical protein [Planctomycetia bacterium]
MKRIACCFFAWCLLWGSLAISQEIDTLWLTLSRQTPETVTVCWLTDAAGSSTVRFGENVRTDATPCTLHQVEIPMPPRDGAFTYQVETQTADGVLRSQPHTLSGLPGDALRVVFLGNLHGKSLPPTIAAARPHLLVSCGDNVPCLHEKGLTKQQAAENLKPFARLVKNNADLFATTLFLSALGNHDREITPRGKRVPGPSLHYDPEATAFCRFFPLPGKRWCWTVAFPEFSLRLVGLDLNHVSDRGTSLETCHGWDSASEQFVWYQKVMENATEQTIVTIQNEAYPTVRKLAGGLWKPLLQKNDFFVAGFGHYAERTFLDGTTYFNTSTYGRGDRYPYANNAFFASADNFLLLVVGKDASSTARLMRLEDGLPLESPTNH